MEVRNFEPEDAEKVSRLIIQNLRQVLTKAYPHEAMEALAPLFTPEKIIDASRRQFVLVGILEDALVGTATLDSGWVKNVFVDVARHRSGVGKKLMAAIEAYAQGQDLKKVYLMAALPACGFYEKLGYTIVKRSERELNGIVISEIQMEKAIPTMSGGVGEWGSGE